MIKRTRMLPLKFRGRTGPHAQRRIHEKQMVRSDGADGRPSREFARPSDFERGWYAQAPVQSHPPTMRPPPPDFGGHPGWSAWLGALTGGLGGVVMIIVAQSILDVRRSNIDVVRLLGRGAEHVFVRFADARLGGIVVAAAIGAMLGAPLGLMTRRLLRIAPRLLFFTLLMPALWLFVRTLVIERLAAGLGSELPFGPLLFGSVVYGACIAIAAPPRV